MTSNPARNDWDGVAFDVAWSSMRSRQSWTGRKMAESGGDDDHIDP